MIDADEGVRLHWPDVPDEETRLHSDGLIWRTSLTRLSLLPQKLSAEPHGIATKAGEALSGVSVLSGGARRVAIETLERETGLSLVPAFYSHGFIDIDLGAGPESLPN